MKTKIKLICRKLVWRPINYFWLSLSIRTYMWWQHGYKNPPFRLLYIKKNRILYHLFSKKMSERKEHLCLLPHGLKWDLWIVGSFISLLMGLYTWQLEVFLLGIFFIIVLPLLIFLFIRIPVLNWIWKDWPKELDYWFKGIPYYGEEKEQTDEGIPKAYWFKGIPYYVEKDGENSKTVKYGRRLRWYKKLFFFLPPLNLTPGDTHYWSFSGSAQESFLRFAIIDFFYKSSTTPFIKRIILFWATPLIAGLFYLILMLLVFSCIYHFDYIDKNYIQKISGAMVGSAILWLLYSILFFYKELPRIEYWCSTQDRDYEYLPPHMKANEFEERGKKISTILKEYAFKILPVMFAFIVIYLISLSILTKK